jgi:hypothetical protein
MNPQTTGTTTSTITMNTCILPERDTREIICVDDLDESSQHCEQSQQLLSLLQSSSSPLPVPLVEEQTSDDEHLYDDIYQEYGITEKCIEKVEFDIHTSQPYYAVVTLTLQLRVKEKVVHIKDASSMRMCQLEKQLQKVKRELLKSSLELGGLADYRVHRMKKHKKN